MATKKIGIPAGVTGPQLAEAWVAMKESRAERSAKACGVKTAKQVENLAKLGLELSKKGACFFCAGPFIFKVKMKSQKIQWSDTDIHECMLPLMESAHPAAATAVVTPATAPAPRASKIQTPTQVKYRNSKHYEKYHDWEDLDALVKAVKKREVDLAAKMYSDRCAVKTCRKPFTITAGMIVRAYTKIKNQNPAGTYHQQHKCRDCALATINALLKAAGEDPATFPTRKQKQLPKFAELTATIGELTARNATAE